jgi:hypothetical protein
MIKDNDVCMFFFNAYVYLNDIDYRRHVNARLDFINECWSEKKAENNKAQFYVIMSYADKFKTKRREKEKKVLSLFDGKNYKSLLDQHFLIDMTNQAEVKSVSCKIFDLKKS